MNVEELKKTHPLYKKHQDEWVFLQAAYEGVKSLVEWGVLTQYERDPVAYQERKTNAFGFNYSKSIVNTTNDFITEIPFEESWDTLADDELFSMFLDDCDQLNTNWEAFWNQKRKFVSILGHGGILIDKPAVPTTSEARGRQVERRIYPYLAYYSPLAILDWTFERNENTGRPVLSYLKLQEDDDRYLVWFLDRWELWRIDDVEKRQPGQSETQEAVLERDGVNQLREIPFVWFYNMKNITEPKIGLSDIVDIAPIDASIIRDASHIDQVIVHAAFPMLAVPKSPTEESKEDLEAGPTRIIDYDSDSAARPFWLEPKVSEAVGAVLSLWEVKSSEIYRLANLGSIITTQDSRAARSGESLKQVFRFLNAFLANKVDNEAEARRNVIYFWLRWQQDEAKYDDIRIEHSKKFDIDKYLQSLDDALTAKGVVKSSKIFVKELEKLVVKRTLPDLPEDKYQEIEEEIEKNIGNGSNNNSITNDNFPNFEDNNDGDEPPEGEEPPQQQ